MDLFRRPRRNVLRVAGLAAIALAGLTCRDRSLTGPGFTAAAHFAVVPQFATSSTAPTVPLTAIRARLTDLVSGDTVIKVALFSGDSAVLSFDVQVAGASSKFILRLAAVDATGDTVYRSLDTLDVTPGDNPPKEDVQLVYASADTSVAAIAIVPRDTVLNTGDTLRYRVTATDAGNNTFGGTVHIAWSSRDTLAAAFPAVRGTILAKDLQDTVWVVASTFSGATDSTRLFVQAAVASLVLNLDTASIKKRDSLKLSASLLDAGGKTLTGRTVTWSSASGAVTVDTAGWVTGIAVGTGARVIASSGGRADTALITVLARPVAAVAASPDSVTLTTGGTTTATATVTDDQGQPNTDVPVAWTTRSSAIATVNPSSGLITAVTAGRTSVVATAGAQFDTVIVKVTPLTGNIDSTRVTPKIDSLYSFGDTVRLGATSFKNNTAVGGSYTWVSRNTAVATVVGTGTATAVANGTTYIVATDTSGTTDSARVTVQQRVATVTVTPALVTRYLGTTQQYAASAVDGRGNPMASASFTWGSTNTAVASVNSSGLATMVGLGADTILATSGSATGRAALVVKSVIQQIIVTPDTGTLTSLGAVKGYTAVAKDTLGATMSGVTFAWSSTNPAVASLSGTTATTTNATALANGNTQIQAVAQSVIGSASLKVQQVLTSIQVLPVAASVGVGGKVALTARGKDAGGSFIPGGSFTWNSSNPPAATVDVNGLVTGVAIGTGTANITASSGAITSNASVITVSASIPQAITFARDTFTLGRQASTSIPVYLAVPQGSPVTLKLRRRYADTVAYFPPSGANDSVTYVQVPANQTSVNVTLNSRNAGFTFIYVTDSSGQISSADTAAVAILSSASFSIGNFSLNATDSRSLQVLLTDPAPAGGSYVAFSYGTAGIAQVSPDPVFIPAGQLAGDIVVQGLTAGSTTITANAPGVSGNSITVNVSAAILNWNTTADYVIGAGQYSTSAWYAYVPTNVNTALTITNLFSDSTVARIDNPFTIPAGTYYQYVTVTGYKTGVDTVTATAPGWTSPRRRIVVSTPHLRIFGVGTQTTTSPPYSTTVQVLDSVGVAHNRLSSLNVSVSTSDSNVVKLLDTLVTLAAGGTSVSPRIQAVGGGTAYIKVQAGGHVPDSTLVTVTPPKINFSWVTQYIGTDQYRPSAGYIYVPNNVTAPLTLTVTHSDSTRAAISTNPVIQTGQYYVYVDIRGHTTLGVDTAIVSAPGYQPDTAFVVNEPARLRVSGGGTYATYAAAAAYTVYTTDSVSGQNNYVLTTPVAVSVTSTNTNVIVPDSSIVHVNPGTYYNSLGKVNFVGVGTAYLKITATGYAPDSVLYTVIPAKLNFNFNGTSYIGNRQQRQNAAYVYLPNNPPSPVQVIFSHTAPSIVQLSSDTLTIPTSIYYQYFAWSGLTLGVDTIIASATGYVPDTIAVRVTSTSLGGTGLPGTATTTSSPASLQAVVRDSLGNANLVIPGDTVTVKVTSSDPTVLLPDSTYVHVFGGQGNSTPTPARYLKPGTASITYSDSAGVYAPFTTGTVTVTGPSLFFSTSSLTVGMRQHMNGNAVYVYTQNTVTGQPVVVYLSSSDTSVLKVPATVTIPVGTYYAYFDVFGQDATGTVQVRTDSAVGYAPATPMSVQVGRPKFFLSLTTSARTTTQPQTVTVYAEDQSGTIRAVSESLTVKLASSAPNVATTDSVSVVIPRDQYYNNQSKLSYLAPGTALLTASDPRTGVNYQYTSGTSGTISVTKPQLSASFTTQSLGVNQTVQQYVATPDFVSIPDTVHVFLLQSKPSVATLPAEVKIPRGTYYQYFNIAGASVGTDTVVFTDTTTASIGELPDTSFVVVGLGLISLGGFPSSLNVGDSVTVTLSVQTPANGGANVVNAEAFALTSTTSNLEFHDLSGNVVTSATVPAGQNFVQFRIVAKSSGVANVTITNSRYVSYDNSFTVP